ncbi:hypothetical protein UlMin_026300 [Ulmus minor]
MEDCLQDWSPCSSRSPSSLSPNPNSFSFDSELWLMAEQRTQEILCIVQPNIFSDKRRKDVIKYVKGLVKGYFGTEVLSFGSFPLKTYLADGDVDLTVFSHSYCEDDLASGISNLLKGQRDFEFRVKDVQYIQAQVKIVKCTVRDIAVDISFNQMAGLCTLCFLEQVDQLVGKDHLFKRSVVLVKAWCYYESRILGAHYGLLSTYAIETLVMYVINLFHSSLRGPLEVLYRFLQYYSTFDWDNYSMSINGPVALSSITEVTRNLYSNGLFMGGEFLKNCRDMFSVLIKAHEVREQEFPIKCLNILDPLKDNNNLGRSICKGNFYRIMCALSHGAQKLENIIMLSGVNMGQELENFFMNTLDRNGRGERPDLPVPVPAFGIGRSEVSDLCIDYDSYDSALQYIEWYKDYTLTLSMQPNLTPSFGWNESTRTWSMQKNLNESHQRGTDAFIPRMPFYLPNASQLPAVPLDVMDTGTSRGTGAYIPDVSHNMQEIEMQMERDKSTESKLVGFLTYKKLAQKGQVADPSKTEKGRNNELFNLSPEEFPILPGAENPVPLEKSHSDQLDMKTLHAKTSSLIIGNFEFGISNQSLSPLGLLKKEVDSTISYPLGSTKGVQKEEKLLKSNEEKTPIDHFQLKDDKDFPPLAF